MKKYLIAFLIIAVVGTSGYFAVRHISNNKKEPVDAVSTVTSSSSVSRQADDHTELITQGTSAGSKPTHTTSAKAKKEESFDAELISASNGSFELESKTASGGVPEKSKVRASAESINIVDSSGKKVRDDDYSNFRSAKVYYSGEVMETYPLMVHADKIVLSQREKCNVYFYLDGKIIKTLTVDTGASIDSADMPNAGAYCDDGYHFDYWMDASGNPVDSLTDINDSIVLNAKISHD